VESILDTNYANIGDVITWTIKMNKDQNKKVFFPILKTEDDKELSIINHSLIMDQKKNIGIKFEITCWDTGAYSTPVYSVEILNRDGSLDFLLDVSTQKFKISSSLLNIENSKFRPILGPVPVKPIFPLKLLLVSLTLILTFFLISLIWNKREKKQYHKAKYLFMDTPKDRALKRLQKLDNIKIIKDFYSEISNISKEFIETRYYLLVLEMTTEEIEKNRSLFPMDDLIFLKWLTLLHQADLVMYANDTVSEKRMIEDTIKLNEIIN
jgi:hypothetical protein